MKRIDRRGEKFGKLLVVDYAENDKRGRSRFLCECDCKNLVIVSNTDLTRKDGKATKSCGCALKGIRNGLSTTRLYRIWKGMIWRCINPKSGGYERYGGRGITVCDQWKEFENFMDWANTNGYADDLTIERKDNNGNYEPDNCKWATKLEQGRNQSQNVWIEYNGETYILEEWSRILGIPSPILRNRRSKGKTGEDLFKPVRKKNNYSEDKLAELYNKGISWKEMACILGVSKSTLGNIIKRLGIARYEGKGRRWINRDA